MPSPNRVRCKQRAKFLEGLSTDRSCLDSQATTLLIGQQNLFDAKRLVESGILGAQVSALADVLEGRDEEIQHRVVNMAICVGPKSDETVRVNR